MTPDRLVVPAPPPDGNCPDIGAVMKRSDVQRGIEPVYHLETGARAGFCGAAKGVATRVDWH